MSSVTEASTSALGKQGEMLFFLLFQRAKLAVSVPSKVLLRKESESERLWSLWLGGRAAMVAQISIVTAPRARCPHGDSRGTTRGTASLAYHPL